MMTEELKVESSIVIGNLEVAPKSLGDRYNWYEALEAVKTLGKGWRLPTKDELNDLYTNRNDLWFDGATYWSSSEYSADEAWVQSFCYGLPFVLYKGSAYYYVRAVRSI